MDYKGKECGLKESSCLWGGGLRDVTSLKTAAKETRKLRVVHRLSVGGIQEPKQTFLVNNIIGKAKLVICESDFWRDGRGQRRTYLQQKKETA